MTVQSVPSNGFINASLAIVALAPLIAVYPSAYGQARSFHILSAHLQREDDVLSPRSRPLRASQLRTSQSIQHAPDLHILSFASLTPP